MHTHLLASSLRKRGHHVTVFASTRSDEMLGLEAICDETSLLDTGTAEAADVPFFREHHAYLDLMTSLRTRSFDVIHNNSLHYLPVSMASTLNTPMVTTLHTPPFCWLESGVRLCRAPNMRFVAVSDTIRQLWSHITTIDRTVANGIDLDSFPFNSTADSDDYLIWYGRIVPEKGLHLAIDAARMVGWPLKIAGPISDSAYFAEEIEPRLGADAIYMGHLEHRALGRLIGGARAFLCTPRWEEPYGLVVAEALACGTPVAAFARGAIPALVDASCGALAAPDDVAALADAARRAMKLDRLSCRRRAEAICDADAMIDAYEALYAEMVEPVTAAFLPPIAQATMAGAA
ncbi:glycosyltransferase [Sphingomonas sp. BT553]|uniref:Glycosyltransferase n=2 Tax=Sphingomonas mollis TaxID=2795726 RepID=A0ABS0XNT5_9SPHN|nr:glycosyltransferase [Sphingomonas sp. BT553]